MSDVTYSSGRGAKPDKPLVWLHGRVRTPPLSTVARLEAGVLLRRRLRAYDAFAGEEE
jgi:hypothetical protein